MHEVHKAEMIQNISKFLGHSPVFDGKSVILFGHCNAAEELADYLLEQGVKPLCFLDNNPEKQGGNYHEIPIFPPEYIKNFQKNDSIVLIANRYYASMMQQLRQLAYDGEVVETVEYDSFQAFSVDDVTFLKKKQRILEGNSVLENIRGEFPEEHLVLCPLRALGDVYWCMSYLDGYLAKHSIKSYVVLVVGQACAQVVRLFSQENVRFFDQKTMDSLLQALVFTHEENAFICHHNHIYVDSAFQILQGHFIEFSQYFRDIIFGLDENAVRKLPTFAKTLSNPAEIPKGMSVIFAPYANSVVEAPLSFWEDLAEQYGKDGFHVFTNIIHGQMPIKGSKPLDIPLLEMISAVEQAGHFVSLRSGLCDVVDSAKAEKTLVFPNCYFSTTKHKISDFFGLKDWEIILLEE